MSNRPPPHRDPPDTSHRRFALGQVVATPGALAALARSRQTVDEFVARHARGDWGDLGAEDSRSNDHAVARDEAAPDLRTRVLSAYRTRSGERLWVITESDRCSTCVLLPEEY